MHLYTSTSKYHQVTLALCEWVSVGGPWVHWSSGVTWHLMTNEIWQVSGEPSWPVVPSSDSRVLGSPHWWNFEGSHMQLWPSSPNEVKPDADWIWPFSCLIAEVLRSLSQQLFPLCFWPLSYRGQKISTEKKKLGPNLRMHQDPWFYKLFHFVKFYNFWQNFEWRLKERPFTIIWSRSTAFLGA